MIRSNIRRNVGLALAAVLLCGSALAQQRSIRFGTDASYPPFESTAPNGEIVGFDIDLAKAMCDVLKAKCTFANQTWDGIIPALLARKYDVIASSMSITPERERAVLFTQKVWSAPSRYVGKLGVIIDTSQLGNLDGVDIGVQQGTVQDKYLSKHATNARLKRYKTIEDALSDLGTGRVKIVFADGAVATDLIGSRGGKGYELVGSPVPESADPLIFGRGIGFAVRKGDTQLQRDLDRAFEIIRANGTYKRLNDKYFKYDIYGQ